LAIVECRLPIDGLPIGDWRFGLSIGDWIADWGIADWDWRLPIGEPGRRNHQSKSPIVNGNRQFSIATRILNLQCQSSVGKSPIRESPICTRQSPIVPFHRNPQQ
jgi:hypothetical protein